MSAPLTWERFQQIVREARAALPPDPPGDLVLDEGNFGDRQWWMKLERKHGRPVDELWREHFGNAVVTLEDGGIPVPAVLQPFPPPDDEEEDEDEPEPPRKPAKGAKPSKAPKASKPERPASEMSEHLQQGGFARVANAVVDQLMSAMSGYTFKALVYCYRLADRGGKFRVGYGALAKVMGSRHRNTGVRVMARLIESGLVERTRTGAEGYTSHYQLVDLKAVDFEKAKAALAKRRVRQEVTR